MKNFLCKHRREVITLAVLLFSTLFSMGSARRISAKYTQSNLGSLCLIGTLPEYCTPVVTGVICTSPSGSATRTWYSDNCVTVLYRLP